MLEVDLQSDRLLFTVAQVIIGRHDSTACQALVSRTGLNQKGGNPSKKNLLQGVGLLRHVMHAVCEAMQLLQKSFEQYRSAFPTSHRRHLMSPSFCALFTHVLWCSFYDRCLTRLPVSLSAVWRSLEPIHSALSGCHRRLV